MNELKQTEETKALLLPDYFVCFAIFQDLTVYCLQENRFNENIISFSGFQGFRGTSGATGSTGQIGWTGSTGLTGNTGSSGLIISRY